MRAKSSPHNHRTVWASVQGPYERLTFTRGFFPASDESHKTAAREANFPRRLVKYK